MGCSMSGTHPKANSDILKQEKRVFFDRFQMPDVIITEEEKAIIKSQWRILYTDMTRNGMAVFLRIFERYPEIKELFDYNGMDEETLQKHEKFKAHATKFMQAFAVVIDNIDDIETAMSNELLALGKKHIYYTGFRPVYFEAYYDAMLTVWCEVLGRKYTKESANAWSHMLIFMLEKLKKGYHLASIEAVTLTDVAFEKGIETDNLTKSDEQT